MSFALQSSCSFVHSISTNCPYVHVYFYFNVISNWITCARAQSTNSCWANDLYLFACIVDSIETGKGYLMNCAHVNSMRARLSRTLPANTHAVPIDQMLTVVIADKSQSISNHTHNSKWRKTNTHFLWKRNTGSFSRSLMSNPLPLEITSGCFLHSNQPTCEKKKPLNENEKQNG